MEALEPYNIEYDFECVADFFESYLKSADLELLDLNVASYSLWFYPESESLKALIGDVIFKSEDAHSFSELFEQLMALAMNIESIDFTVRHLEKCSRILRQWQKLDFKNCLLLLYVIDKGLIKAIDTSASFKKPLSSILYTLLCTEITSAFGSLLDNLVLRILTLSLPSVGSQADFLRDELTSLLEKIDIQD